MGLEKGGIYRHFDSKQQLAAEAFDYAWKLALDTRFEGAQAISNTVDRLKQMVRNFQDRWSGLVPGRMSVAQHGNRFRRRKSAAAREGPARS
jgi:TetR/AcrR family transcriptional repressor of nem operon